MLRFLSLLREAFGIIKMRCILGKTLSLWIIFATTLVVFLQEFLASQEEELVLPYPPPLQQWCPPVPDIFKVSFDAAFFRSSNLASFGVLVRDSSGAAVGALSVPISLGCSVAELEALACLRAVQFALEIGRVVFEGDSAVEIGRAHV